MFCTVHVHSWTSEDMSRHRSVCSSPGHFVWALWCTKWHSERSTPSPEYLEFPLSVSNHRRLIFIRQSPTLYNFSNWCHHWMILLKSHRRLNCSPQLRKAGDCFRCRRKCGPFGEFVCVVEGNLEQMVEKLLLTVCWRIQFMRLLTLEQDKNTP
jgi:hypothetical protein